MIDKSVTLSSCILGAFLWFVWGVVYVVVQGVIRFRLCFRFGEKVCICLEDRYLGSTFVVDNEGKIDPNLQHRSLTFW